MPIYEYQCTQCGKVVAGLRPVAERDRAASCPQHGTAHMFRKISITSFSLRGGGWAKDGYTKK